MPSGYSSMYIYYVKMKEDKEKTTKVGIAFSELNYPQAPPGTTIKLVHDWGDPQPAYGYIHKDFYYIYVNSKIYIFRHSIKYDLEKDEVYNLYEPNMTVVDIKNFFVCDAHTMHSVTYPHIPTADGKLNASGLSILIITSSSNVYIMISITFSVASW